MVDFVNIVMLVAATTGSLALGVLTAYGVLRLGFSLMRPQPKLVVDVQTPVAQTQGL
jgi:hypothetical protein